MYVKSCHTRHVWVLGILLSTQLYIRNTDCDYSSAYVTIFTDGDEPLVGHGMTFTIGRGTDIVSSVHFPTVLYV